MRIVVASARSPFAARPGSGQADELARVLREAGHRVEQVWLAVDCDPARSVLRDLAVRLTDISDAGEVLIALRSPSHLLRHPGKVMWFDGEAVPGGTSDDAARADRIGIAEAQRVFVTSAVAGRRLHATTGVRAPVLEPERLATRPAEVVTALLG